MEWMFSTEIWIALLTLSTLEIVLGIDNLVFISIAVSKLPPAQRPAARRFGLALAFIILVGVALIADGFEFHIDRKFLYFAMAFSAGVEALNILATRKKRRKMQSQ